MTDEQVFSFCEKVRHPFIQMLNRIHWDVAQWTRFKSVKYIGNNTYEFTFDNSNFSIEFKLTASWHKAFDGEDPRADGVEDPALTVHSELMYKTFKMWKYNDVRPLGRD